MKLVKDARHTVFVILLRGGTIAVETARIVDQLTVILLRVPLGPERVHECGIGLWRQSVQRPTQPNVKEVHEARVGNDVIVRRIRTEQVYICLRRGECTFALYVCVRGALDGDNRMVKVSGYPFHHRGKTSRCPREGIHLAVIPCHRECETCECITNFLAAIVPCTNCTTVVAELAEAARQSSD